MSSKMWFNFAVVIAVASVLSVIYVIFPESFWSSKPFSISAISLSLAIGYIFYIPSFRKNSSNDSAIFALIGPQAILVLILLGLTFSSFHYAILGLDSLAIALDIIALAFLLISQFTLRASAEVIEKVSEKYSKPSNHTKWQTELNATLSIAQDKNCKNQLKQIVDALRYAPNDLPESTPHDNDVQSYINEVNTIISSDPNSDISHQLSNLKLSIELRNGHLKSARNKA